MNVVRCPQCRSERRVAYPNAPAARVCANCQRKRLEAICGRKVSNEEVRILNAARHKAVKCFARLAAKRHVDREPLQKVAELFSGMGEHQVELISPPVQRHFGLSFNDFIERFTQVATEVTAGTPMDRRFRRDWYAPAVLPLYEWWRSVGFDPKVRIPDSEPGPDEAADGANSPFVDFLIFQLQLIEKTDARELASAASVKKLDEYIRKLSNPRRH